MRLEEDGGRSWSSRLASANQKIAGFASSLWPRRHDTGIRQTLAEIKPMFLRSLKYIGKSKRRKLFLAGGTVLLAGLLVTYNFVRPNGVLVAVEGKPIGIARNEQAVSRAVSDLENELAGQGLAQAENLCSISTKPLRVSSEQVLSEDTLKSRLKDVLSFQVQAAAISINGNPAFWLADQATAEQVLEQVKEHYSGDGNGNEKVVEVSLEEKVEIVLGKVKNTEVLTPEEAVKSIIEGVPTSQKYIVANGDSLWSVAREHDLLVEDIKKANPQLKGEFLEIGDTINLVLIEPPLHVKVVQETEVEDSIPYEVEIRKDNSLYNGQEKVKQEGKPGLRKITYRVVTRNGVELSREEAESKILKKPVTEIVAVGSRRGVLVASRGSSRSSRSSNGGSGQLSWPVSGSITSAYGYRGSEFHDGIDIASPIGTAIYAAAGGKVASAGYEGGYGRTILVDHGNGVVTRYAHLSEINVNTGQSVSRGQLIGRVGVTGRTTGPHLHFEVIDGGSNCNPLNYLN